MNELLLASSIFCSHLLTTAKKQVCVYDYLACAASIERQWEWIHEDPSKRFYIQSEKSNRLQGVANCILIDFGDL